MIRAGLKAAILALLLGWVWVIHQFQFYWYVPQSVALAENAAFCLYAAALAASWFVWRPRVVVSGLLTWILFILSTAVKLLIAPDITPSDFSAWVIAPAIASVGVVVAALGAARLEPVPL